MTTLRAAAALGMLLGFYVLAIGMVVALGLAAVWAFSTGVESGGAKLGILAIIVTVSIVAALWKVARARPGRPSGIDVPESSAPELWRSVREIARTADTRAPDEILLVPDVNAAVAEETRLLGLVGGRRTLVLGVPLVLGLSTGQLRSVLAHELGHYSRAHTRLAPVTYRGTEAVAATVGHLSGNVLGWLLGLWGRLYVLVNAAVSRAQEREADVLSARVAGVPAAQSALREVVVLDAAWDFYLEHYVGIGWEDGLAPEPAAFFGGFAELLAARSGELSDLRASTPPSDRSRWDSHPPIAERVAALGSLAVADVAGTPAPDDELPARRLLPGLATDAARLAAEVVDYEGRTALPWDALVPAAMPVQDQHTADLVYRAAARVVGAPRADLATVCDLARTDAFAALRRDLLPVEPEDGDEQVAGAVEACLRAAAVRAGIAAWRPSWSGPAVLVRADGTALDLAPLARRFLTPSSATDVPATLAALGIDAHSAVQVATTADAHGAQILGGLANVTVDGTVRDLLVLDVGLVVAPCPRSSDGGTARLLALAQSAPASRIAAEHAFLPYEQIRSARIRRQVPARVEITLHDGRSVTIQEKWTGDQLTKDSRDQFLAHIAAYVPDQAAGAPTGGGAYPAS